VRLSTLIRWAGPAAIGGGVFMVFSELAGLPVHIPYLTRDAPAGYAAVGTGLILFALVLLLVGMVGLYACRPGPYDPRVIEHGDARARYVLTELYEEESHAAGTVEGRTGARIARRVPTEHPAAPRRHRGTLGAGGRE
jgi:hypothetical protein